MQINRLALLNLFDRELEGGEDAPGGIGAHVSAITGVIGEDLILGLLCKYWQDNGYNAQTVSYQCRAAQGRKKLDAWVARTGNGERNCLFQVEVKNWSFHSYGMRRPLNPEADGKVLNQIAGTNWNVCIEALRNRNALDKVMLPMVRPQGYAADIPWQPLLAFWCPYGRKKWLRWYLFFSSIALDIRSTARGSSPAQPICEPLETRIWKFRCLVSKGGSAYCKAWGLRCLTVSIEWSGWDFGSVPAVTPSCAPNFAT